MVTTWRTTKTESGFQFDVYTVEYQQPIKVIKSGFADSRAKAVTAAKKLVKQIKASQR